MRLHLFLARAADGAHLHVFDEAVRMVRGAARELGLSCSEGYEPGPGVNLVIGACEMARQGAPLPPRAVVYTFEQHAPGSVWATPEQVNFLRHAPLWSYDPVVSARLAAIGGLVSTLVPVGYSEAMVTMEEAHEDIDVAFFGSPTPARQRTIDALVDAGLDVVWKPAFGAERDAIYARAKVCLSLASHTPPVLQSLRIGHLLANRRCVLSDPFLLPGDYPYGAAVEVAETERLVERCCELVADAPLRRRVADRGFHAFRAWPFRDSLAPALAALADRPQAHQSGNGAPFALE